MNNQFDTLGSYVGFLYGMKLDSEIMGYKFQYQKDLDALENWAHEQLEKMDINEDIGEDE